MSNWERLVWNQRHLLIEGFLVTVEICLIAFAIAVVGGMILFHGTTVVLFDKTYPDQPTNKPVCTDCHGVHDIANVNDPAHGLAIRENLLVRCQKCHPDATANFPDSWMSHYIPSTDNYPIVYYVNLFYKLFIPAVLGPMVLLVVMDFGRMVINRFKKQKHVADKPAGLEGSDQPKQSKSSDAEERSND